MKKQNLLKLAFAMLAMVIMTGAMAQIPVQYTQDETLAMVQTEGISFRLYVQPDAVYSPNYTAVGGWILGTDSRWTFTLPAGLVAVAPVVSGTAINQNWVEISNPVAAAADYTVGVLETNQAFTCVDGGRTTIIQVIAAPTATLATTAVLPTDWIDAAGVNEFYRCVAATDAIAVPSLSVTYTEDARRVANEYDYILTVTRGGYDINDNVIIADVDATATLGKGTMNAITAYTASPIAHIAGSTMSLLVDGTTLVRTKYVFTLANISSKTSYLSYFRANTGFTPTIPANYYAVAAPQTVTLWLNPAPVTGPIYHIPNNYVF